ncbi:SDR family NAD(P)-dependent oxidoreductase [Nocardia sp. 004]|uniref:SDR family NAD(P)-dependent oxidoreductase n=1 Tax=Nocardia sp. 004 TaxID=3385978 RepID=UPI0039A244A0
MAARDQMSDGRDLSGKTVVVTGSSSGIGAAAAQRFATRGATVAVVGRSPERTAKVASEVGAESFVADFARLDDVRKLAGQLLDRYQRIDILANNAGGTWSDRTVTEDGNELTFQVNHLAPFLLTNLLLERLTQSQARVVNTGSMMYRRGKLDLDEVNAATGTYSQFSAYSVSKLATVLFTRELARRTEGTGLTAVAFHPGSVATNIYENFPPALRWLIRSPLARPFFIGPDKGAESLVHLVTLTDGAASNGQYFHLVKPEQPKNKQAVDTELAQRLWAMSERLTGIGSGR